MKRRKTFCCTCYFHSTVEKYCFVCYLHSLFVFRRCVWYMCCFGNPIRNHKVGSIVVRTFTAVKQPMKCHSLQQSLAYHVWTGNGGWQLNPFYERAEWFWRAIRTEGCFFLWCDNNLTMQLYLVWSVAQNTSFLKLFTQQAGLFNWFW